MRSFSVRVLLLFALVSLPVVAWRFVPRVPDQNPPLALPSVPRAESAVKLSPRRVSRGGAPVERTADDPVAALMRSYVDEIRSLDIETFGAFSNAVRRAIADQGHSDAFDGFRVPAREGIDEVLATIPGDASGQEETHDRMLLAFFAAAIVSGETEEDRIRNVGFLAERYHLLSLRQ